MERVSYDVPTPSAARGILEAIHWKRAIVWRIDRIHILNPIRFANFRRNEVGAKASVANAKQAIRSGERIGISIEAERQQRATTLLVDVAYVIEAHFEMTERANGDEPAKHLAMFNRRAEAGQCFHRPCLGTREFPADFALLPAGAVLPTSRLPADQRERDLGWMLHDIDFKGGNVSRFFRARLRDGVLDVNACLADGGIAA